MNITNGKIKSGLLVTDVSDHLAVLDMDDKLMLKTKKTETLSKSETILALKAQLMKHDCQEVYVEDINDSYNEF